MQMRYNLQVLNGFARFAESLFLFILCYSTIFMPLDVIEKANLSKRENGS